MYLGFYKLFGYRPLEILQVWWFNYLTVVALLICYVDEDRLATYGCWGYTAWGRSGQSGATLRKITMPRVLLIIVTYQAASWLKSCMRAAAALQPLADVAVVDNASTDGTRDLLSTEYRNLITTTFRSPETLDLVRHTTWCLANPSLLLYDYYFLAESGRGNSGYGVRRAGKNRGSISRVRCA